MIRSDIKSIALGGPGATFVMTLLMLIAPVMGMPKMWIGNMLAHFLRVPVYVGWIVHFIIGTLIAGNYVFLFSVRFHFAPALKGLVFSLIPFLMAQTLIFPMMGAGFFSARTPAPFLFALGSLIGHLVYGAVLGYLVAELRTTGSATNEQPGL